MSQPEIPPNKLVETFSSDTIASCCAVLEAVTEINITESSGGRNEIIWLVIDALRYEEQRELERHENRRKGGKPQIVRE